MVLDSGLKKIVPRHKCLYHMEKWQFMAIFLYNLYIFVYINHGCLTIILLTLDSCNGVIKRIWCKNTNADDIIMAN